MSPEMTMHYAQTLDATAKAEFLRYRKVTSHGSDPAVSSDDLYDLMALDKHTDRVLPNGWCTLPPAKTCGKGNACLTCDLFVTDARFLSVHEGEIVALDQLVDSRQRLHTERTGEPMSENHVWLTLRRRERRACPRDHRRHSETTTRRRPTIGARGRRKHARRRARRAGTVHRMSIGNAEALRAAAQRKSASAKARADAGIRALIKAQRPITFESVAQEAHVSKDFLYRTPELRERITSLRARTSPRLRSRRVEPSVEDATSSIVRTLTVKLSEERAKHRAEIVELRQALEAAHGELLRLRRRFGPRSTDAVGPPD